MKWAVFLGGTWKDGGAMDMQEELEGLACGRVLVEKGRGRVGIKC